MLDQLTVDDAPRALIRSAQVAGVDGDEEAARTVVEASGGYPYFIQQFGQTSWALRSGRRSPPMTPSKGSELAGLIQRHAEVS
jgi:hypothetical protein